MAGLLDYGRVDPLALGLLGAGTALMTPRAMGGGVPAAFNQFSGGMLQGQQLLRQQALDQQREELLRMQMAGMQDEREMRKFAREQAMSEAQKKAEREAAMQSVLSGIASRNVPGFRDANIAAGGTAPAGYMPPGSRPKITEQDMAQWLALGGDPKQLEALATATNLGRPEVARVVEARGADGTPTQLREDKYGGQIGAPVAKPVEMRMQDLGDRLVPVNQFAPPASLPKSMSPGERASNALGWANNAATIRGQNLTDARARETSGRPVWDESRGMWMFAPTGQNPSGAAVPAMGPDNKPLPPVKKPLTESQAKSLSFGVRMAESNAALEELANAGTLEPGRFSRSVQGVTSMVPLIGEQLTGNAATLLNATQTGPEQRVEQAQRDFINAVLRRESGAVISPSEFDNARRQYFPQPGDEPETLAQKARNRQVAIESMLAEVPDAYRPQSPGARQPAEQRQAPAQQNPARQAPTFSSLPSPSQYRGKTMQDTLTGKSYKSDGFRWVEQ